MTMDSGRVQYLAKLIRLEISHDETADLSSDLKEITSYMVDLKGVEQELTDLPKNRASDRTQPLREDQIQNSLGVDDALKNAPGTENKLFKVPRVIQS